jgi:FdhD protein
MFAFQTPGVAPAPVQRVTREAWRDGFASLGERSLAEEVPVAFAYDGATHAVLMATPDDLEDFALGFSRTEGIIAGPADIAELAVVTADDGIVLRMWLRDGPSDAWAARRRRFVGAAGCGMCGLESLAKPTALYRK